MSQRTGTKTLTAMLSIATLGAALSFGMGTVLAAEEKAKDKNVSEGEILRALAPEVERISSFRSMQHGSHPPRELLCPPDAAQAFFGVAIQQFHTTGLVEFGHGS